MNEITAADRKIAAHRAGQTFCECDGRKEEGEPFCLSCRAILSQAIQAALVHGCTVKDEDADPPVYQVTDEWAAAYQTGADWLHGWSDRAITKQLGKLATSGASLNIFEQQFVPNVARRTRDLTILQRLKAVQILTHYASDIDEE